MPRTHVAIEIAIAAAVSVERHDESSLPAGWDRADLRVARAFGDAWIRELRTAVLTGGSFGRCAQGRERASESAARGFQEDRCREPGTGGVGCPAVRAALNLILFGPWGRGLDEPNVRSLAHRSAS